MEFKFRGFDTQTQHNQVYRSPALLSSSGCTYSSDQAIQGPVDMREAIMRALEKERIREEIMAEEIARKRVLEAEVRRELMWEREMMAMQRAGKSPSSFMLGSPPSHNSRFERVMAPGQLFAPVDGRLAMSFQEQYGGSGRHSREIGGFEVVPFQRLPRPPKIKEIITSLPEDGKKEVIGLGKPNSATLKRKPSPSPPSAAARSSALCSYSLKKKRKEEWSCADCEVSATCERSLNEHFAGKKHQAKVAALRVRHTGADLGLRAAPKKPTTMPAKLLKSKKKSVETQPSVIKKSSKCVSVDLKKENGKAEGEHMRQKFRFWCEMCNAGAPCEKVMNRHKRGKKHSKNLLKLNQKPGGQAAASTYKAPDSKENLNAETMVVSDKAIVTEYKESKVKTELADSEGI